MEPAGAETEQTDDEQLAADVRETVSGTDLGGTSLEVAEAGHCPRGRDPAALETLMPWNAPANCKVDSVDK